MKVNGKNIELTSVSAKTVTDYLKILRINPGTVANTERQNFFQQCQTVSDLRFGFL